MKIEKNILEKSVVELIVEEKTEKIAKYRKQVLNDFRENADIKGFRKWANIPESIILQNYWEERIIQMTIEKAIDHMYKEAMKKEKLLPVAEAEITEIISQDPLKIKIHIEVFPEVEVDKKYKDIKLKKKAVKVTEKEVQWALDDIQAKFTKFEEESSIDYKIVMWDKVTIDTDGYNSEWKLLETTSMREYPILLGSGILVEWFESGIVWSKLWDELELDLDFPKDYHNKDFAGKKTKFKVKIKKIEKAVKPEFTKEFIKDLRGKDLDLDWFKDLIKQEIKDTKEANARLEDENKLIDELLKVTKLDIWEKLLSNKKEGVLSEIKSNMTNDGIKFSDYMDSLKLSEENYVEKYVAPIALRRLEGELILHKIMWMEKIEVSNEELDKEVEKILARFESEDVVKKLKDLYVPWKKYYEELRQRLAYKNLVDSFFE